MKPNEKQSQRNNFKCWHRPGIWEDKGGDIHFAVPELLAAFDIEQTPDNVRQTVAMLAQIVREQDANAQIIIRKSRED